MRNGLYALKAVTLLAWRNRRGAIPILDIAYGPRLPEKFLEPILLPRRRPIEDVTVARVAREILEE